MKENNYLDSLDLESQEHLSAERLELLKVKHNRFINLESRPTANFIDLMNWGELEFKQFLKDQSNLNKYIHNRIVIDGVFLQYAQENSIQVECLLKDSIVSWKTEHDFEQFFMQGVFKISNKDTEFLLCTLMHKSNQYEDEISFFTVVSNKNINSYLKLRNDFDTWTQTRDRSNLYIRVVGGEDLPYTKDHKWSDIFLPEDLKTEIKNLVEGFLASKDFYARNSLSWKKGIILYGSAGCGKSSLIRTLISEYNFKPVTITAAATDEDIKEAFDYAEQQSPSLLYFEDLDSLLGRNIDTSTFLNLMDGVSSKDGLFTVATANEIKLLKDNIINRPSRFDRKFEIPLPTQEMAHIYLKKWFKDLCTTAKYKELAKCAENNEFSYAHLKELYTSSMFEAIANNRKSPTEKDIQNALNRLIKDKNLINRNKAIDTNKYF